MVKLTLKGKMCNGMIRSLSEACWAHISVPHLPFVLLLVLAVVSTGQGSGCVRPYMVQNSWVNLTETNRGLFPVGTVLQYSCDPGYQPDGPSILTCTTLGLWSSEPPRCIRSDVCRPLSKPENGGYICHPSPCRMFTHGTVIEFFCDEGFILKGDYKYLACQDGQWDGPVQISCVSQGCIRPFLVPHGSTNLTETNRGSFPVGTVLEYRCDPGYQPDGPTILTCSALKLWSSEPPRCIRSDVCQSPYQPENGGYTCHPSPCQRFSHGTVIEYFCEEGYILKGDYKYLTCQYGEWDNQVQISCLMEQDHDPTLPLGMPALSIVASTASSVALILLLVVLLVLLQPKLKSLHRRDQGVSGQPVSIMVEGVQVTLPSYEEAVSGGVSTASALSSESRVQIVLSEGQHATAPEAGPSRPSSFKQQHSEMDVYQPIPPSSSSQSPSPSSSTWALEHAGAAAPLSSQRRLSAGSNQYSLPLFDSEMDYSDDMPLLKEA